MAKHRSREGLTASDLTAAGGLRAAPQLWWKPSLCFSPDGWGGAGARWPLGLPLILLGLWVSWSVLVILRGPGHLAPWNARDHPAATSSSSPFISVFAAVSHPSEFQGRPLS